MEPSSPNRSHAVVVGGGMAGLLAARMLADHFDRVTIVDRDRFPERPEFRKGVPQSRHVHVLLARGAALLEQQFPGISTELGESGAVVMRWPADAVVLGKIGWCRRHPRSLGLLSLTRHLLEWTVRRRVAVLPGVRFVEEHDAVGLFASPDGTRVRGLRLRSRAGADGPDRLEADLVVDASGRDSKAPDWLAEIGYERPRETKINGFLGY